MNKQAGFTLIELIAVIVILGILAAVAVPKFVDLSTAAEEAAVEGVAGSLASASALNHANNVAADAGLTTTGVTAVALCENVANLLDGGLPDGYAITTGTGTAIVTGNGIDQEGGSSECTVGLDSNNDGTVDGTSTTFVGYGVSTT